MIADRRGLLIRTGKKVAFLPAVGLMFSIPAIVAGAILGPVTGGLG
ncbi:MAG: hypothetical protein RR510_02490 [Morganella sp. (in: enterobacteria)]